MSGSSIWWFAHDHRPNCVTIHARSPEGHGVPAYIASEVLGGEPHSPASDLYSLGIILYELMTGQPPAPYRTDLPDDTPEDLCELTKRLLQPDPNHRPTAGDAFSLLLPPSDDVAELAAIAEQHKPTHGATPSLATTLPAGAHRQPRRRWLRQISFVIVSLLLVALGWVLAMDTPEPKEDPWYFIDRQEIER